MSDAERDPYTGYLTTGHEWNGIKELNTPLPRVLLICLALSFVFALLCWYLLPAWPLGDDYTRGRLGIDQRGALERQLLAADGASEGWRTAIESESFERIRADANLMSIVRESGPALYRDNCSVCHGRRGEGGRYFPSLSDESWMWGDDPEGIARTLQVGINSRHPDSRVGRMPAFGVSGTLSSTEIEELVLYLRSRADLSIGSGTRASELLAVNAGEKRYESHCAACHGAESEGNPALGAPSLVDEEWLYGSDEQSLRTTIRYGRAGHMPAWKSRLDPAERKILALHVLSLANDARGEDDTDGSL